MKKKILFLIDSLGAGGAEKVLLDLVESIDKEKFDVTLCSIAKIGELVDKVPDGVNLRFAFRSKYIYYAIILLNPFFLYKMIVKGKYDIEVAFLEGRSTKVISGSTNKKSKKIAWVHTDMINNHWTKIFFRRFKHEKKAYKKFDEIFCVSDVVKNKFIEKFDVYNNVKFVQNPINDIVIREKANEIDGFLMPENIFNIVTVGTLKAEKGYDRLLKVVKRLNDDGLYFNIHIVGDGLQRDLLESIKDRENLNNVFLHGFKYNPYPYIKSADLFVCSSIAEGYSTVVTEAVILETPVITTDCSGMDQILGDGEYGYIVENSEEALYKGLREIITNKELYETYKEKVKLRSNNFKLDKIIKEIEVLIGDK